MHFIFTHAWTLAGGARVGARPPLEKKYVGGFFPCVVFYSCVENILGLSPLTEISGGDHAFAARVVPNNNVALAELERSCENLIHIGAHFHLILRKSIK